MIVLKDDRVRLVNGDIGVVLELWGRARPFLRFKRDADGKSIPMPASDVAEVLRPARGRRWGG